MSKAYIGEKVIYAEKSEHEYVHVAFIDGENLIVSEGGQLLIPAGKKGVWNKEKATHELVPFYDAPEQWNFVYDNKNPNIEVGVYHRSHDGLPELFENVDGDEAA